MKDESDRRLDKTIRWSGILIAVIVVSYCGTPFVNDLLYRRERARLMDELRPMIGLTKKKVLASIRRSSSLAGYKMSEHQSSILLMSPNQYSFIYVTGVPAAELTMVEDRVTDAKLLERGSAL